MTQTDRQTDRQTEIKRKTERRNKRDMYRHVQTTGRSEFAEAVSKHFTTVCYESRSSRELRKGPSQVSNTCVIIKNIRYLLIKCHQGTYNYCSIQLLSYSEGIKEFFRKI